MVLRYQFKARFATRCRNDYKHNAIRYALRRGNARAGRSEGRSPWLLRALRGRHLTIGGPAIVIGMLTIELISAHWPEAAIYHPQGSFTRTFDYLVGAAATACGALLTSPTGRSRWETPG